MINSQEYSVVFVDSRVKNNKKIIDQKNNMVFFVDEENNVNSINVFNKHFANPKNHLLFSLNDEEVSFLQQCATENGLKISNDPKFVYVQIKKREVHPKSEKLFVLTVFDGVRDIQIVTNTLESTEGKVLVMAKPGSFTFKGDSVVLGKLMDVESEGMLTGYKTLGLEGEGLIFGTNEQIGKDFVI